MKASYDLYDEMNPAHLIDTGEAPRVIHEAIEADVARRVLLAPTIAERVVPAPTNRLVRQRAEPAERVAVAAYAEPAERVAVAACAEPAERVAVAACAEPADRAEVAAVPARAAVVPARAAAVSAQAAVIAAQPAPVPARATAVPAQPGTGAVTAGTAVIDQPSRGPAEGYGRIPNPRRGDGAWAVEGLAAIEPAHATSQHDGSPDAPLDGSPDAAPDAAPDVSLDAAPDAPLDAAPDAPLDAAPDGPLDVTLVDAPWTLDDLLRDDDPPLRTQSAGDGDDHGGRSPFPVNSAGYAGGEVGPHDIEPGAEVSDGVPGAALGVSGAGSRRHTVALFVIAALVLSATVVVAAIW